jgi:predicted nucleotidyltransferase
MRRRGDGTVYLRPDGRWSGQIRCSDGRRHTVYGRTREEASEKLSAVSMATPGRASTVPSLEELRHHAEAVRHLSRREGASNVRVFGSVARGEAGPGSDYDFVVDLDPKLRGFEAFYRLDRLERSLRGLLGRPVHVVTARHQSDFTRRVLRDAVAF